MTTIEDEILYVAIVLFSDFDAIGWLLTLFYYPAGPIEIFPLILWYVGSKAGSLLILSHIV